MSFWLLAFGLLLSPLPPPKCRLQSSVEEGKYGYLTYMIQPSTHAGQEREREKKKKKGLGGKLEELLLLIIFRPPLTSFCRDRSRRRTKARQGEVM
jgi:hypothetical protein